MQMEVDLSVGFLTRCMDVAARLQRLQCAVDTLSSCCRMASVDPESQTQCQPEGFPGAAKQNAVSVLQPLRRAKTFAEGPNKKVKTIQSSPSGLDSSMFGRPGCLDSPRELCAAHRNPSAFVCVRANRQCSQKGRGPVAQLSLSPAKADGMPRDIGFAAELLPTYTDARAPACLQKLYKLDGLQEDIHGKSLCEGLRAERRQREKPTSNGQSHGGSWGPLSGWLPQDLKNPWPWMPPR